MPDPASIVTPDRRVRVFISSTLGELAPERDAVDAAVRTLRMTPVRFEVGARVHRPGDLYRWYLDQSYVFVGIYRESYGCAAPRATRIRDRGRAREKPGLPAPDAGKVYRRGRNLCECVTAG